MKLFIISPSLGHGGAERVAALWACGFHRRGHQVTVITKTSDPQVYPLDEGIEVLPYYPMGGGRLSKLIPSCFSSLTRAVGKWAPSSCSSS